MAGFGAEIEASKSWLKGLETVKSQKTTQREISQVAVDKIMADLLGSEQGLASLAMGESVSGGFGSTAKTQLSQDFLTNVIGQIATLTSKEIVNIEEEKKKSQEETKVGGKAKAGTVICTELLEQGRFPSELYFHQKALAHFMNLPEETVAGYHAWAMKVVSWMKKSPLLSKILLPVVMARYLQIIYGNVSVLGSLTIYIGQPICYTIGCALKSIKKEQTHGHANT